MPFDDRLRRAFRREIPEAGFVERTMAGIEQRSRRRGRGTWAAWLAVAASISLFILGGNALLKQRQAAIALETLELALRVASDTVNHVQTRLGEATAVRGVSDAR